MPIVTISNDDHAASLVNGIDEELVNATLAARPEPTATTESLASLLRASVEEVASASEEEEVREEKSEGGFTDFTATFRLERTPKPSPSSRSPCS